MFTKLCCTKRSYFSLMARGAMAENRDGVARSMQPDAGHRTNMHCAPSSGTVAHHRTQHNNTVGGQGEQASLHLHEYKNRRGGNVWVRSGVSVGIFL